MRWLFLFAAPFALIIALAGRADADSTSADLYRWGNASSPKLDNIRPDEIGTFG